MSTAGEQKEKLPEDVFWETYLEAARDEDEARKQDWDGIPGSILTFTGLFAAIVAAFVIESYKSLSPDSGDQTVILLAQLVAATTNATTPSLKATSLEPFHASSTAVMVNALWLCSLIVALASALLATLVQQWSRNYFRDIAQRHIFDVNPSIRNRAYNQIYIRTGVDRYNMHQVVYWLVGLVHLSVVLFVAGLVLFMFDINMDVAWCATSVVCLFGAAYLLAFFISSIDNRCPYKTPLTYAGAYTIWVGVFVAAAIFRHLRIMQDWWHVSGFYFWSRHVDRRQYSVFVRDGRFFGQSSQYFKHAWHQTSRHMLDTTFKTLLQSTLTLLESTQSGIHLEDSVLKQSLRFVLEDARFLSRMHGYVSSCEARIDPSANMIVLQMTYILSQALFDKSIELGPHKLKGYYYYRHAVNSYMSVLSWILSGKFPPVGQNEGPQQTLMAQFCTFNLRWSLLTFCQRANDRGFVSPTEETMISALEKTSGNRWWRFGKDFEHPSTFLVMLNSTQFNGIELLPHVQMRGVRTTGIEVEDESRVGHENRRFSCESDLVGESEARLADPHDNTIPETDPSNVNPDDIATGANASSMTFVSPIVIFDLEEWKKHTHTCLIPVHDGACCKSRDSALYPSSLAHIAACNALTMINHLLRTPKAEWGLCFDGPFLKRHHGLWRSGSPFMDWPKHFPMSEVDCRLAPSSEFLLVLRSVGLESWLELDNDCDYDPAMSTHLPLLTQPLPGASGHTILDVFKELVKCVNLSATSPATTNGDGESHFRPLSLTFSRSTSTLPLTSSPEEIKKHPQSRASHPELTDKTKIGDVSSQNAHPDTSLREVAIHDSSLVVTRPESSSDSRASERCGSRAFGETLASGVQTELEKGLAVTGVRQTDRGLSRSTSHEQLDTLSPISRDKQNLRHQKAPPQSNN